ncbi:MAG: hypothetical protein C0459_02760 [Chitinophaga sp.]|jgi:hypothetical protein|nr:hypothetical protein [Chitinophaga sp.]
MKKLFFTSCFLLFLSSLQAQQKITLHFHNKVGDKDLQLFTETYTNKFGESFTVNRFKYYISKIILIDSDSKYYAFPSDYFLIDEADSLSKTITLTTAAKKINDIQFLIGIDSIKNVSGVQTGALDPMKGMFWTWNTGYVFAKLEGQSDASHAPQHLLSYHVGGFKQNENALRFVRLNIGQNVSTKNLILNINADILKWFDNTSTIKIANQSVCHQPGNFAMQLADNYAGMFSIQQ